MHICKGPNKHHDHPPFPYWCIELVAASYFLPRMSSYLPQMPPFCLTFGCTQTTISSTSPRKMHFFLGLFGLPSTRLPIGVVAFVAICVPNYAPSFKGKASMASVQHFSTLCVFMHGGGMLHSQYLLDLHMYHVKSHRGTTNKALLLVGKRVC